MGRSDKTPFFFKRGDFTQSGRPTVLEKHWKQTHKKTEVLLYKDKKAAHGRKDKTNEAERKRTRKGRAT